MINCFRWFVPTLLAYCYFSSNLNAVNGQCASGNRPLNLNGDGGFVSPQYPANYNNNADCQWLISSSGSDSVVRLDFVDLYTENNVDYINIYDGTSTGAPPIVTTLSGSFQQPPYGYTSSQQNMFVRFVSSSANAYRGFNATFKSVVRDAGDPCAADTRPLIVTTANFTFTSPNYPQNYSNNADCQWLILQPLSNGVVTLDFKDLSTQAPSDQVSIYNGMTVEGTLITSLTGDYPISPTGFTTSGRSMYVRFTSSQSTSTSRGFVATTALINPSSGNPCTPELQPLFLFSTTGQITSPLYPVNYQNNANCQWRIFSSIAGGVVSITFFDFFTEANHDYVYILDGSDMNARPLVALTGTYSVTPAGITTRQSYMYVYFMTDGAIVYRGFNASFTSAGTGTDACQAASRPSRLTKDSGTILSPNYPLNYPTNSDCQWLIMSGVTGGILTVDFADFYTQANADFLYLYDGGSVSDPLIQRLTGSYIPLPSGYTTSQLYMYLRFTSNTQSVYRGFNATYRSVIPNTGDPCSAATRPVVLTTYSGTFSSPNFPSIYPGNVDCQWLIISAEVFGSVNFDFDSFSTVSGSDYVNVYNGINTVAPLLTSLTGNYAIPLRGFVATQRYALVRFTSAASSGSSGFNVSYSSFASGAGDPCAAETKPVNILSSAGQIISPLYPNAYPPDSDCQWKIVSNSATYGIVRLSFYDVDIAASSDSVTVYDGSSYDWPVLATFSGTFSVPPQGISSTQPYMYLRLQSSSTTSFGRGFNATYTSSSSGADACLPATRPNIMTSFSGSISSPNYPSTYPASSDCQWTLIAAPNSVVVMDFSDIYTRLNVDFVYLYDGGSATSARLATLTGLYTTPPTGLTSSQRFMFVRFTSSTTQLQRGFRAAYYSVETGTDDPCSSYPSILIGDNGTFSSSIFSSGTYPPYSNCGWRLMANNPNAVVTISFVAFDTSVNDYVNIYDGSSEAAPLLTSLSGTLDPPPGGYSTTQRYAYIQFVSGDPSSHPGFLAVFVAQLPNVGDPCSTSSQPVILTSSSATITSPMFPVKYTNNSDCQWRIVSPFPNGGVTLSFSVFSTRAEGDVVSIYNGPTANDQLLVTLSGNYSSVPAGISTRQPYMFVRFTSGINTNYQGFNGTYSAIYFGTDACTTTTQPSVVVTYSGTITSPGYPNDYTNYANCQWRVVSATAQDVIVLDFNDINTQATYDIVYIYDGSNANSQLIDAISGFIVTAPQGYTSSQRYMFVRFISSSSTVYRGFSATFTSTTANSGDPCSPLTRPLIVTTLSDFILSPNYPMNYPPNSTCLWRIVSGLPGGVIQLDFTDFATMVSDGVLNLYDGTNTSAPLIISLTGSYARPLVGYTTRTRVMFVQFLSGSAGSGRGFNATFTPQVPSTGDACSTSSQPLVLLDSSGVITSPTYPTNYADNSDCQWRIVASDPSSVISVDFTDFITETNADYVYIYDGPTADYPLLAVLSGSYSVLPAGFSSRLQFIYIRFSANDVNKFKGFRATFSSQIAGANPCSSPTTLPSIQTAYSGILTSTNYPSNYPSYQDCRWRIISSEFDGVVVVDFDVIYLTTSTNLNLYDGTTINDASLLLTSQTGLVAVAPEGFTSTQHYMTVRFSSSSSVATGFRAIYKSAAIGGDACSAATQPYIFVTYSATINSPGYPFNHPPFSDCQWRIVSAEPLGVVVIDFIVLSITASADYVYIYDGPSSQEDVVQKLVSLTGSYTLTPRGITTTQRFMLLRFTTGSQSAPAEGFHALYYSATADVGDPCVSPVIIRSATGTITSPTYPTNYPRNSNCQWRFVSTSSLSVVTLSFTDFYTNDGTDFVYIYDGPTADYPLLATLSGNYTTATAPQGFSSRQRFMYVRFTSDENFTNKGFSATYSSQRYDSNACTSAATAPGIVLDYSGILTSPNHPAAYPASSNCQWRLISSSPSCVLLLDFTAFYTRPNYDFVSIYDGGSVRAPALASLSGNQAVPPTGYRSTQRYMYMTFTSSSSVGPTGFSASFTSVCTDDTTTTSMISSATLELGDS